MRTLPREPWRGSQICGYQIAYGMPGSKFCAERKVDGLYFCQEHHDWCAEDEPDGIIRMAPGNAIGAPQWALRLLWEPCDGESPIEPSYEEMERYASA